MFPLGMLKNVPVRIGQFYIPTNFIIMDIKEDCNIPIVIRGEELTIFGNAGLRFAFVFAKYRGKQESPPTFILSNKERKKSTEKFLFRDVSRVRGVDYRKGRC